MILMRMFDLTTLFMPQVLSTPRAIVPLELLIGYLRLYNPNPILQLLEVTLLIESRLLVILGFSGSYEGYFGVVGGAWEEILGEIRV